MKSNYTEDDYRKAFVNLMNANGYDFKIEKHKTNSTNAAYMYNDQNIGDFVYTFRYTHDSEYETCIDGAGKFVYGNIYKMELENILKANSTIFGFPDIDQIMKKFSKTKNNIISFNDYQNFYSQFLSILNNHNIVEYYGYGIDCSYSQLRILFDLNNLEFPLFFLFEFILEKCSKEANISMSKDVEFIKFMNSDKMKKFALTYILKHRNINDNKLVEVWCEVELNK